MFSLKEKLRRLQKWFFQKTEFITNSYRKDQKKLYVNMGEIYYVDLGINIGAEIDKHRPFIIFQNNSFFTKNSDLVFGFPITSNCFQKTFQVSITNDNLSSGNLKNGMVLISQGKSISKHRIDRKLGKIDSVFINQLSTEYEQFLYKNTPRSKKLRGKAL